MAHMQSHPAAPRMYPLAVECERVRLREVTSDDHEAIQGWTGDAGVVRYLPFGPLVGAELADYVDRILCEAEEPVRTSYHLLIEHPTDEVIGAVSLTVDSELHRRAELGFVLHRHAWGHGYASEAAAALTEFGFDHLGLHRVWAICAVENRASARVLERIGMVREGTLREHLWVGDRFHDTHVYARLATATYL